MQEPRKLFSIITVCLNPGADLEPTVASVLAQDFQDYELIIKDGGSTDGTRNRSWTDPKIRFYSSPDKGIFDAMNQALNLATGEFVCFLNAGDYFVDPRILGDVAHVIKTNREVEFFYGDVLKPTGRAGINIYPNRLTRFYLFMHMLCHQCWFLKKRTYLAYGGFETECSNGADYRLLLKMIIRDRLPYTHVPRVIVSYKGEGYSANPEVQRASAGWQTKLKKELYTAIEFQSFTFIWKSWTTIKALLYDRLLFVFWRKIQHYRSRRNEASLRRTALGL